MTRAEGLGHGGWSVDGNMDGWMDAWMLRGEEGGMEGGKEGRSKGKYTISGKGWVETTLDMQRHGTGE